jgi:hypothetical protein
MSAWYQLRCLPSKRQRQWLSSQDKSDIAEAGNPTLIKCLMNGGMHNALVMNLYKRGEYVLGTMIIRCTAIINLNVC